MPESKPSDGLATVLAILLALVLLVGGGAFYVLLQRQQAIVEFESAKIRNAEIAAEAARQEQAEEALTNPQAVEDTIRQVLQTQQQAWNDGDIDRFMRSYWKSNELTFSSGGKVTRGWQATLEGYKQRYATRQEMGSLAFSELEITPLGHDAALVLGNWRLTRETDTPGGKFSLVFRRIDDQWLIVHDHTSKADQ